MTASTDSTFIDVLASEVMKNNKIKNKIRRCILSLTHFLDEVIYILDRI